MDGFAGIANIRVSGVVLRSSLTTTPRQYGTDRVRTSEIDASRQRSANRMTTYCPRVSVVSVETSCCQRDAGEVSHPYIFSITSERVARDEMRERFAVGKAAASIPVAVLSWRTTRLKERALTRRAARVVTELVS